jgi:CsoR family transcriptional regulator, copper-sensing transcriptional repressor
VRRMGDEEAYCVNILWQISSYIAASEQVASLVLKDHMDHCVREALEDGTKAEEKIQELQEALELLSSWIKDGRGPLRAVPNRKELS